MTTGLDIKDQFPQWRDTIIRADGLVIVTPEYNHGYPGALKSVLDLLLKEYVHKAVAFVGVSAGRLGRNARDRGDGADGAGAGSCGDVHRPSFSDRAKQIRRLRASCSTMLTKVESAVFSTSWSG